MKKKLEWLPFAMIVSAVVLLLVFGVLLARDEQRNQSEIPESWGDGVLQEQMAVNADNRQPDQEWDNEEDVLEGDAPIYDDSSDISFEIEGGELFPMDDLFAARGRLTALAEEYNELIPYGYKGRSWSYGYFKQEEGYKNILYDNCENGLGLDGIGYVIWLFRNSFGHTPDEFIGDFSVRKFGYAVEIGDLEVGDICLTADSDTDVDYGVVCGFVDGHAVVTMCDNSPNRRFEYGCNHMVYIKQDHDRYLGYSQSVDFQYFYRLEEVCVMEGKCR